MGNVASIISNNTGCSRRKAEEVEGALVKAGLIKEVEQEKKVEKIKRKGKEYSVEVNEVLSAKDAS